MQAYNLKHAIFLFIEFWIVEQVHAIFQQLPLYYHKINF